MTLCVILLHDFYTPQTKLREGVEADEITCASVSGPSSASHPDMGDARASLACDARASLGGMGGACDARASLGGMGGAIES